MKRNVLFPVLLLTAVISLYGCALGVTKLKVTHDPLAQVEAKKDGKILIREFVDKREPGHDIYIGNKRNSFGMVLGNIDSSEKIEPLLTKYFAEALQNAGYTVLIEGHEGEAVPSDFNADAVMEGEISEFWLDLYMAVWQDIDISVKVLEKDTNETLWKKGYTGSETNVLWLGINEEFEKVIRQALTKVLNQATADFSSEEFHKAIKTNKGAK